MNKKLSGGISLLLSLILLLSALPAPALAASQSLPLVEDTLVNPIYEGILDIQGESPREDETPHLYSEAAPVYTDIEDAAAYLRQGLVARADTVVLTMEFSLDFYNPETYKAQISAIADEIFYGAIAHTGNPQEGDYIRWQYDECGQRMSGMLYSDRLSVAFTFTPIYYSTLEQEEAVTEAVCALLAELDVDGDFDYYKVKAVYDYICQNVTYDHENLNDKTYVLKHTAYAALINGTAVCQGYALLLYRLCLELGIDCRLIPGDTPGGAHGWNIIRLGDRYYNADSTWDAGEDAYDWFLVCPDHFPDHFRYNTEKLPYDSPDFHSAHPMADADYTVTTAAQGSCGENLNWLLDSEGVLTVTGEGAMTDYDGDNPAPWSLHARDIQVVVLSEDLDHVGSYAFSGCENLGKISFLGDAPSFGQDPFLDVTAKAEYPIAGSGWEEAIADQYGGELTWKVICTDHKYEAAVTPPTCLDSGFTTYTCRCGDSYIGDPTPALDHSFTNYIFNGNATCFADGTETATCNRCSAQDTRPAAGSRLSHDWSDATCTAPQICSICGSIQGDSLGHDYVDGICSVCGGADPDYVPPTTAPDPTDPEPTEPDPTEPEPTEPDVTEPNPTDPKPTEPDATEPEVKVEGVTRLAGENRLVTSELIANQLKEKMGVEKFQNIIVASGGTFADALPGSYLSAVKNAPILLTLAKDKYVNQTADYIKANLAEGGTVYILGGESAVPKLMEDALAGINVKRVAGADRFGTNLAILKEAGVKAGDEILACTAKEFADSLSAAATGKPILLVYKKITDEQKTYLGTLSGCKFTVVGGTTAVPENLEEAMKAYGEVSRLAGKDRLDTSILVAKKYFPDATTSVVAFGWDFPDGLCGGSLAYATKSPLILAHSKEKLAQFIADYTTKAGLKAGYVLGGEGLVSEEAVASIFKQ